jgi:hypothetical protein
MAGEIGTESAETKLAEGYMPMLRICEVDEPDRESYPPAVLKHTTG